MSTNKQHTLDNYTLRKIHSSEIKILDEIIRICEKHNLNYFLIGGTLLGAVRHKGFIPWDDDLDIAMPREDYEKFIKIAPRELDKDFVLDDISTNSYYWLIFAKVRLKNTIYKTDTELTNKYNGIWVDIFPFDYTKHFKDKFIKLKWSKIRLLKAVYIRKNPSSKQPPHAIVSILSTFLKPLSATRMNKLIKSSITKENKNSKCKYFINYGSQYGIIKQIHRTDKILPLTNATFEGKEYRVPKDSDYVLKNIYGPNYMQLPPKEKRITHNPDFIKFEDGEEIHFDNEKE